MRKRITNLTFIVLLIFATAVSSGCMAHTHVVGTGAGTGVEDEARQWYVLWGLVPINDVDSSEDHPARFRH